MISNKSYIKTRLPTRRVYECSGQCVSCVCGQRCPSPEGPVRPLHEWLTLKTESESESVSPRALRRNLRKRWKRVRKHQHLISHRRFKYGSFENVWAFQGNFSHLDCFGTRKLVLGVSACFCIRDRSMGEIRSLAQWTRCSCDSPRAWCLIHWVLPTNRFTEAARQLSQRITRLTAGAVCKWRDGDAETKNHEESSPPLSGVNRRGHRFMQPKDDNGQIVSNPIPDGRCNQPGICARMSSSRGKVR